MNKWINESPTDGGGATLLMDELLDGKKMLERSEEIDPTDSERVRLEGDINDSSGVGVLAIAMLMVLLIARGVVLPPLAVGSPELDSM